MRLSKHLNLVIPVEREIGKDEKGEPIVQKLYVHSTPVNTETFENWELILSKTFASLHQEDTSLSAPRVALVRMKKIAKAMGIWEGHEGVEAGLVNEIRRLTNVFVPGLNGWEMLPLGVAFKRDLLSEEELSEIENAATFFTVSWRLMRDPQRMVYILGACDVWNAQTTLLSCSEWKDSLPNSTGIDNLMMTPPEPVQGVLVLEDDKKQSPVPY